VTARAIGFAAGASDGGADAPTPDGLCRARGGAIDVLYLPPGAPAAPRDRFRAVLAAHRALAALLPLPPRCEVTLEKGLALAEHAPDVMLQRLRDVAQVCEFEILWQSRPGRAPSAPGLPQAHGGGWLRARARRLADGDRRCAALRASAERAGAAQLRCRAGPDRTCSVIASQRSRVEALQTCLADAARDPALQGGSLLVTGPWPAFTLAGDVAARVS
jgi:hypothetical protein